MTALSLLELWLLTYGKVGAITVVALAFGYIALHRLVTGPTFWPLAIIAGFGMLSLSVALLSWVHAFTAIAIALLAAVVLVLALVMWLRRSRAGAASPNLSANRLTIAVSGAIVGGFLLVASVLTIYPVSSFDATMYHLPLARDLVQNHGFSFDPFVRYSFFPQANEAIFAIAMLLSPDPRVSAGLELVLLVATIALVFAWFLGSGRSAAAASIAAFLVLASPIVVVAGTAPLIDVWSMASLTAALVVGLLVLEDKLPWIWASFGLAGFLVGQAAAAKYTGALFGGAVIVGLVAASYRLRGILPQLAAAAAGLAIAVAPWYAWTLHVTGDPVYPFLTGLFGNRPGLWTETEITYQKLVARDAAPGIRGILRHDLAYLLGRSPLQVIAGLPPINPLAALGLPAVLVRRWWHVRPVVATTIASILSLVIWVGSTSDPRYLVPALGVMAIGGGLLVEAFHALFSRRFDRPAGWFARHFSSVVLVPVAAIVILAASAIQLASTLHAQGLPPTTESATSAYLAKYVECYEGVAYLNDTFGSTYTAYGWNCESAKFYASGTFMGDWFGRPGYFRTVVDVPGPPLQTALLASRLRALGATYLIVPTRLHVDPAAMTADGRFRLVYASKLTDVFQVLGAPVT